MLNDDQYTERTPDLIVKIRKMREAAEKEMNRFTNVADYDVRRVVGQRPKTAPVPPATVPPPPAADRPKKSATKSASAQTFIEFAPAPAGRSDCGEDK